MNHPLTVVELTLIHNRISFKLFETLSWNILLNFRKNFTDISHEHTESTKKYCWYWETIIFYMKVLQFHNNKSSFSKHDRSTKLWIFESSSHPILYGDLFKYLFWLNKNERPRPFKETCVKPSLRRLIISSRHFSDKTVITGISKFYII